MNLHEIERRLNELRASHVPGSPLGWEDVECLRLQAAKLSLGVAWGFNARWFADMGVALQKLLERHDRLAGEAARLVQALHEVGEQTLWRDGDNTDRVYSWGELAGLRKALAATPEHPPVKQTELWAVFEPDHTVRWRTVRHTEQDAIQAFCGGPQAVDKIWPYEQAKGCYCDRIRIERLPEGAPTGEAACTEAP